MGGRFFFDNNVKVSIVHISDRRLSLSTKILMTYKNDKSRYGENFQAISKQARLICKVCCWCLENPSKETHHTRYVDQHGILLLDRAEIGIDLIPLCISCHKSIHKEDKYVIVKSNDSLNHNTDKVIFRLQFGYLVNVKGNKQDARRI